MRFGLGRDWARRRFLDELRVLELLLGGFFSHKLGVEHLEELVGLEGGVVVVV